GPRRRARHRRNGVRGRAPEPPDRPRRRCGSAVRGVRGAPRPDASGRARGGFAEPIYASAEYRNGAGRGPFWTAVQGVVTTAVQRRLEGSESGPGTPI